MNKHSKFTLLLLIGGLYLLGHLFPDFYTVFTTFVFWSCIVFAVIYIISAVRLQMRLKHYKRFEE